MVTELRRWGDKITFSGELRVRTCWCGMPHAVPEDLLDYALRRKNNNQDFSIYCPLGHAYVLGGESELNKTKRLLETERRVLESKNRTIEAQRRRLAAAKGQQTKLKNRIAKGVCPCCNRQFQNLERHMKGQHPEFVTTEGE